MPSGNAMAALNLLELARVSGEDCWLAEAGKLLKAFAAMIEQQPEGTRMLTLAVKRWHESSGAGASSAEPGAGGVAGGRPGRGGPRGGPHRGGYGRSAPRTAGSRFGCGSRSPKGWHLYAPDGEESVGASTTLAVEGGELRNVEYPPGETVAESAPTSGRSR